MTQSVPPRPMRPCRKEIVVVETHGKLIALDVNSLAWWPVRPGEVVDVERQGCGQAPVFPRAMKAGGIGWLCMNITHRCNLACSYCFDQADGRTGHMSLETALAALSLFDAASPKCNISFFGGEPLLNWDVLVAVALAVRALAARLKKPSKLCVTTNGTMVTMERARILAGLDIGVLLSLDGPQDIHDQTRKTKTGHGSFEATLAGIRNLNAAGIRPTARGTFDGRLTRMLDRVVFFEDIKDCGMISGYCIEAAMLGEGCATPRDSASDLDVMTREFHAVAEWVVARARASQPCYFDYFAKMLQRLINRTPFGCNCGAGNGYLGIGPDGGIYACHREVGTRIGTVGPGFTPAREPWLDNTLGGCPACADCWCRHLCGGGCRQHRAEAGDIAKPVEVLCALRRMICEESLWILAELTPEQARKAITG